MQVTTLKKSQFGKYAAVLLVGGAVAAAAISHKHQEVTASEEGESAVALSTVDANTISQISAVPQSEVVLTSPTMVEFKAVAEALKIASFEDVVRNEPAALGEHSNVAKAATVQSCVKSSSSDVLCADVLETEQGSGSSPYIIARTRYEYHPLTDDGLETYGAAKLGTAVDTSENLKNANGTARLNIESQTGITRTAVVFCKLSPQGKATDKSVGVATLGNGVIVTGAYTGNTADFYGASVNGVKPFAVACYRPSERLGHGQTVAAYQPK